MSSESAKKPFPDEETQRTSPGALENCCISHTQAESDLTIAHASSNSVFVPVKQPEINNTGFANGRVFGDYEILAEISEHKGQHFFSMGFVEGTILADLI